MLFSLTLQAFTQAADSNRGESKELIFSISSLREESDPRLLQVMILQCLMSKCTCAHDAYSLQTRCKYVVSSQISPCTTRSHTWQVSLLMKSSLYSNLKFRNAQSFSGGSTGSSNNPPCKVQRVYYMYVSVDKSLSRVILMHWSLRSVFNLMSNSLWCPEVFNKSWVIQRFFWPRRRVEVGLISSLKAGDPEQNEKQY